MNNQTKERLRVSVVIPTYARPQLMLRAVQSVLAQDYPVAEVLVVDDENSPNTAASIAPFLDSRVRLIAHTRPMGGSAARNTGILAASGDAIAFLDDDDAWLPRKLSTQIPLLQSAEFEATLCGYFIEGAGQARVKRCTTVGFEILRKGNPFPTSGLVVRSEVIKSLRFDADLPNGQDWDLLIRLACRGRIAHVPEALFVYNDGAHVRISNATAGMNWDRLQSRLRAIEKHQHVLGRYWTRFLRADELLSYFRSRENVMSHIAQTARSCGLAPTMHVLSRRICRKALSYVGVPSFL